MAGFNARTLRSFFNGKFLLAVVIFYTLSHLIHVELITDETTNAESYPDADQHLPLQKPTQMVVNADGSASVGVSENSRSQIGGAGVGAGGGGGAAVKPMVVGGMVNGQYVAAKDLSAAQDSMNGIQPTVDGINRTSMTDGMRMMLCGDPPNVATLIKAHYCETKMDPTALDGLQGIPLRPFLMQQNNAAAAGAGGAISFGGGIVGYQARLQRRRQLSQKLGDQEEDQEDDHERQTVAVAAAASTSSHAGSRRRRRHHHHRRVLLDFNSVGDGTGVDDTDGEDEAGANAKATAEDAAEGQSFAEVVAKVNRGLAPVPGSGQVFVHKENAMLFGRGLAADAEADPSLIPANEAAALDGHMYQTCSVVGSSGILRKTAYGAMIDSADAVFRINQAPTIGGCALFTGGRTSVRVINAHWLHKYSHGDQLRRLPVAPNATLVVTRYEKGDYTRLVELWRRYRPDVKIRLLTRDTMHGATLLLHSFQGKLAAQGLAPAAGGDAPSSGIITLYLALRLCQQVTVYGYGLYVPPKAKHLHDKLAWYHYFRGMYGKKGMDQTHSFDSERLLFGALAKAGHVKMCGFRDAENPRGAGVGDGDDTVEARIKEEIERHTRKEARAMGRRGGGGGDGEFDESTPEGRRAARQARRAARRAGGRGVGAAAGTGGAAGAGGAAAQTLNTREVLVDPSSGVAQSGGTTSTAAASAAALANIAALQQQQQQAANNGGGGGAFGVDTSVAGAGAAVSGAGAASDGSLPDPGSTPTTTHIDENKWNAVLGNT